MFPEEIAKILAQVTSPGFSDEEIKILLSKVLDRKSISKEEIEHIQRLQQSLRAAGLGDARLMTLGLWVISCTRIIRVVIDDTWVCKTFYTPGITYLRVTLIILLRALKQPDFDKNDPGAFISSLFKLIM